jgi:hypothetical protein
VQTDRDARLLAVGGLEVHDDAPMCQSCPEAELVGHRDRNLTKAAEGVIAGHVDVVERQVRAYNERDIDAFVACYSANVVVEDARGAVLMSSREGLRDEYAPFFRDNPSLHGEIRHRAVVGDYVVDDEEITGWQAGPVQAVAIYHVADGVIDHVRLIG